MAAEVSFPVAAVTRCSHLLLGMTFIFPHLLQLQCANVCLIAGEGIAGSFLLGAILATASSEVSFIAGCFNASCCSFTASC